MGTRSALRRIGYRVVVAPVFALLAASCGPAAGTGQEGDPAASGSVVLEVTAVPPDATCIEVTVTSTRTVTQQFDVQPNQTTPLSLTGLPLGAATIDERAFAGPCSGVTAATSPTWVAQSPVSVNLIAGQAVTANITLNRPGQVHIVTDFQDVPGSGLTTLATGQGTVSGIAVDATNVYFTSTTNNSVVKVPIAGGATVLLASGQPSPKDIVTDGTNVYWTNNGNGTVMRVAASGGASVVLASGQATFGGLAIDATNLYWTAGGNVMRTPKSGSLLTVLASGQANPEGIASDGTSVYWANRLSGAIMREPVGGGGPVTLFTGPSGADRVALDSTAVYWTNQQDGTLKRGAFGGFMTNLATGAPNAQSSIAADDNGSVYWVNSGLSSVMKVPVNGGAPVGIAAAQSPTAVAIDAANVYWANSGNGTVMKAVK